MDLGSPLDDNALEEFVTLESFDLSLDDVWNNLILYFKWKNSSCFLDSFFVVYAECLFPIVSKNDCSFTFKTMNDLVEEVFEEVRTKETLENVQNKMWKIALEKVVKKKGDYGSVCEFFEWLLSGTNSKLEEKFFLVILKINFFNIITI